MKKTFSALSLLLILVISLCSCAFLQKPPSGEGGEENFVYNESSELYLIVSPEVDGSLSSSLSGALDSVREGIVKFAPTDSEPHSHEIVLGNTEREISLIALERLARLDKENADDRSFLIYFDGKSVAIVYEDDEEGITASLAVDHFINNYVKSTLVCNSGTVYSETVNILEDYYGKMDEEYFASAWEKFE